MAPFPRINLGFTVANSGGGQTGVVNVPPPVGSLCLAPVSVKNTASPIAVPTDTTGDGLVWKQIGTTAQNANSNYSTALFYKIANAATAAGLVSSGVDFAWSGTSSAGEVAVDAVSGWLGIPTLDLVATPAITNNSSQSTSAAVTGTAISPTEFVYSVLGGSSPGPVLTGGSYYWTQFFLGTQYPYTFAAGGTDHLNVGWATAAVTAVDPLWFWQWTTGAGMAILGCTFYDAHPTRSVVSQAVKRSANWMQRAKGLLTPPERELWRPDLVVA